MIRKIAFVNEFYQKNKFLVDKIVGSTILMILYAFSYFSIQKLLIGGMPVGERMIDYETWVDGYIPWVPAAVFFYYLYYIWVFIPPILAKTREALYHVWAVYAVLLLTACITFVGFPGRIYHPSFEIDSLANWLLNVVYSTDKGYNLFPSLHAAHAFFVAGYVYANRRAMLWVILPGSLGIIASTVLIKQHYFVDILGGLAYTIVAYYVTLAYMKNGSIDFKKEFKKILEKD